MISSNQFITQLISIIVLGALIIGLVSVKARGPKELITFEEMADPTVDTLSDWSNVPSGFTGFVYHHG